MNLSSHFVSQGDREGSLSYSARAAKHTISYYGGRVMREAAKAFWALSRPAKSEVLRGRYCPVKESVSG